MNRTREIIFMGIGILTGITLCGPAAHAATTISAALSNQPIYVNGQRVSMTAYTIGGNNYVKLRDIGQAVDFGVTYDAATNSVHIDPNSSYQEEVKQVAQTPTTPSATDLSEENVRSTIRALRDIYPTNTPYGAPYRSTSNSPYGVSSTNCAGWAVLCSDAAFGKQWPPGLSCSEHSRSWGQTLCYLRFICGAGTVHRNGGGPRQPQVPTGFAVIRQSRRLDTLGEHPASCFME